MSHKVNAFTMLPREAMKFVRYDEESKTVSWVDRNGVAFKTIYRIHPRNVRSWWSYLSKTQSLRDFYFN